MRKRTYEEKQNNRQKKACFLLVFLLIFFSPDTYTTSYFVPFELSCIAIAGLLVLYYFFFGRKSEDRIRNYRTVLAVYFLMVVSLLLCKAIHQDSNNFYYRLVMYITLGMLFTIFIGANDFMWAYTAILRFLCVFSLAATAAVLFFDLPFESALPTILHRNPEQIDSYMRFKYLVFCNVYLSDSIIQFRNYGIFYEPGRFLFYIFVAAVFALVRVRKGDPESSRDVILFTLTMLSTFSPIGMVAAVLLIFCYDLVTRRSYSKYLMGILLVGFCGVLVLNNEMLHDTLMLNLRKLRGGDSLWTRLGSVIGYFQSWFMRPVFGWGYSEGMYGAGSEFMRRFTMHNTTTTMTNLACFGLVYGLLHVMGMALFFLRKNFSLIVRAVLFLCVMMLINTQRFLEMPVLFVLIFYGYSYVKLVL